MSTGEGPLEDKLSTEPALRHPTPRTGVSIAEILAEDGASASDSTHSDGVGSDRGPGSPPLVTVAPSHASAWALSAGRSKGPSSPPADTDMRPSSPTKGSSRDTEQDQLCGELVNEVLNDLLHEVWDELKERGTELQGTHAVSDRLAASADAGATPFVDTSEEQVDAFVNAMMKALTRTDLSDLVPEKIDTSSLVPTILASLGLNQKDSKLTSKTLKSTAKSGKQDQEAWTKLQLDMMQEIVKEEPEVQSADSRWLNSPLALFQVAKFGDEIQDPLEQRTWAGAKKKLKKHVALGFSPHLVNSIDEKGPSLSSTLMNEDSLDLLLESEINSDEKNWLNIDFDVKQVHQQISKMILQDIVDETAAEIQKIYAPK